ncbi:hypothetical protein KB553_20465 [Chryseobacterium rhizoplanae]|uniref:hypothetical protein n=1 Tax=Chryseobacterium rhizoplanae TaxID=1609531 RepID=UPI001CE23750|nr:hypothetical protein [Chryseobacterium rhizoplanae]UCA59365.1 hypothetical protein KB553_20465 [Chryseobacterium rhizoplanae]
MISKEIDFRSISFYWKVKVYNFEVEGNHNYYVSEKGILVHNNCEWLEATVGQAKNRVSTEPGM